MNSEWCCLRDRDQMPGNKTLSRNAHAVHAVLNDIIMRAQTRGSLQRARAALKTMGPVAQAAHLGWRLAHRLRR